MTLHGCYQNLDDKIKNIAGQMLTQLKDISFREQMFKKTIQ